MGRLDLDAVRDEAAEEPHGPYILGGEEFYLPRTDDWPAEALELAASDGKIVAAFKMVLGDDYDRWAAHRPSARQYRAIFDDISQAEGFGESGNSSGSSRSSRSTPARSKRTSPATTG